MATAGSDPEQAVRVARAGQADQVGQADRADRAGQASEWVREWDPEWA